MVGPAATDRSAAALALTATLTGTLGCGALALGRAAFLEAAGLWAHRDDLRFDDLVLAGALGVLAVCSGWLVLGIALTLGTSTLRCSHTLAGRLARALTPALVRSLLGGACGAAVLVAPSTVPGALAVPVATAHPQAQDCPRRSCSDELGGLPLPDRPWGASEAPRTRPEPEHVRVRPGDSLWAIAAQHLTDQRPAMHASPPSHAEIAAAWPRWFAVNHARIGDDPDLIRPGTRLAVPQRLR